MTDIDIAFRQMVLEKAGVRDIIGTRLYPDILPDDVTLPAAVYTQISDVPEYTNDHAHGEGGCAAVVRYQIDCYGNDLAEARRAAGAIRYSIGGTRARVGGRTIGMVKVANSFSNRYEEEDLWRITTDYQLRLD